jgi:hypothetical protein
VGKATRPVVGWILVGIGAVMIIIGYVGVARQVLVAKQLPYVVSGGILGVAVVTVGVLFIGTEELRRDSGRLDRLELMVAELHRVLLTRPDAPALHEAAAPAGAVRLVALPDGERYHTDTCAAIVGKEQATVVTSRTIARRSLTPCPLCEPVLAAG